MFVWLLFRSDRIHFTRPSLMIPTGPPRFLIIPHTEIDTVVVCQHFLFLLSIICVREPGYALNVLCHNMFQVCVLVVIVDSFIFKWAICLECCVLFVPIFFIGPHILWRGTVLVDRPCLSFATHLTVSLLFNQDILMS